jgi:hypothetical protein
MPGIPRICAWSSLLLVAVATGALFHAGESNLATTTEIFLFIRLAISLSHDSEFLPKNKVPFERDYVSFASTPGAFGATVIASVIWLALGSPPGWAEKMILTWFWIITVGMFVFQGIVVFALTSQPWIEKHYNNPRRRIGGSLEDSAQPTASAETPEPIRTPYQQFNLWLWRVSWIVLAWALWTAGQPLLAGLYLTGRVLVLASRAHARSLKYGDTARIDPLARTVHFLLWRPVAITATVVGTSVSVAMVVPLTILGAVYSYFTGKAPVRPGPDSDREARVHEARCRRAAASYRLREEFGRPAGFVYFMGSEPHQRKHFLESGGLLSDLGDKVVARDYREHVLETRTAYNWMEFEQAPEGALLHVNGVSNMRRDLPFIAIVPPRGRVQTFRLSEPYRARGRDKGEALKQAEAEVRAAIEATFGPAAGEAESC